MYNSLGCRSGPVGFGIAGGYSGMETGDPTVACRRLVRDTAAAAVDCY